MFYRQNELKSNENNYPKIILFVKEGGEKNVIEKLTKTKNLFYLKLLQPAVHSDNKRKARRNKQKLVLASSSKTKNNHLYNQVKA